MPTVCPICQTPADVISPPPAPGLAQAACPRCHANLLILERPEPPLSEPTSAPAAPLRSRRRWLSTDPSTRRFAFTITALLCVLNYVLAAVLVAGYLLAIKQVYDPYEVDFHPLSPMMLRFQGWTNVHLAAARGHVREVHTLLAQGENIEVENVHGRTPLFEAAKRGRTDIVRLLLDHGAKVNVADQSQDTPLLSSVHHGHAAVAQLLLERGASPQAAGLLGSTPLHTAANLQNAEVVRVLLANGASVDARNTMQQTPLHVAAGSYWKNDPSVALALLEAEPDLEARDQRGYTPLLLAAETGNHRIAEVLLDRGANREARCQCRHTALYMAAKGGHKQVVTLLLDRGAQPNVSSNGRNPLHAAAKNGHLEIVESLLTHGADVNATVHGKTALQLAEEHEREWTARILRQRGGKTFPALARHMSQGKEHQKNRRYDLALAEFEQAVALAPGDPEAYYLRGSMYMHQADYGRALKDLELSLSLDPTRMDAYINLASVLSQSEDWNRIIASWSTLLTMEPALAQAYWHRGVGYLRAGNTEQAMTDMLTGCRLGYHKACESYEHTTGRKPV